MKDYKYWLALVVGLLCGYGDIKELLIDVVTTFQ